MSRVADMMKTNKATSSSKLTVKAKEPTLAEISASSNARPAASIQKQIEDAHNSGDDTSVMKLIPQLPKDLQDSVASALGIKMKPQALTSGKSSPVMNVIKQGLRTLA
jgi:hypothetical protein